MDEFLRQFPELNEKQGDQLKVFHVELLKFTKALNLISPTTIKDLQNIHFYDCLMAVRSILHAGPEVFDIGSGNGFPGIVLAVVSPDQSIQMIESDRRKAEFLKHVIFKAQIPNARVLNQRVETLPPNSISLAISRAFAPLNEAIPLVDRAFSVGGRYFHMKNENWDEELSRLSSQFGQRWEHEVVQTYQIPGESKKKQVVCGEKRI